MTPVETLLEEIDQKSAELHTVFEEAGDALDMELVKSIPGDSDAKVAFIRERSDELSDLRDNLQSAIEVEKARDDLGELQFISEMVEAATKGEPINRIKFADGGGEPTDQIKSLGKLFTESAAYRDGVFDQSMKGRSIEFPDFDVKTLFETTAGWLPESTRTGMVVDYATRPIEILDFIPQTTTGQAAVVYMEETTYTQAAAETAEGGSFPESAFALTERTSPVRKISHFVPVTDEQLEDVDQAAGYLDNRLRFGLRQRLDSQILVGDGIAPNLEGVLNRTGIQTQAKGADPTPDAVYKALTKVRVTGRAVPNVCMFHPNDWQDIRLLRTTDGIYIWGSPADAGPARIWGLPVVETSVLTENTGLVGDFANFSELAIRRGVEVKVSDSHSDYFVKGKQAIRADMRAALQVYRAAAFATVTGI